MNYNDLIEGCFYAQDFGDKKVVFKYNKDIKSVQFLSMIGVYKIGNCCGLGSKDLERNYRFATTKEIIELEQKMSIKEELYYQIC